MLAPALTNALSVDVEDYFQVSAFERHIARSRWDTMELRVERNTHRVLDLFAARGVKATFFTLGWVAERCPALVRRIVADGHELASHGHGHQRAHDLDAVAFRQDLVRAKGLLEDIGGVAVQGYRAPSFSISGRNLWAFDVLAETGHRYSSSVYPVQHDHYGMPDAPRFVHRQRAGVVEIPPTTLRLRGRNLPSSGGGFFRLLPYPVSRWMIRQVNAVERQPAIFYFHPWELDPDQPRTPGIDLRTRFRHYVNLDRNEAKLGRLLADFRWGRMDDIFLARAAELPSTATANAV